MVLKRISGQGIIEALIGAAIIGITAGGLGMAINQMGKTRLKTQIVSNAVSLESSVVGALQDPGSYSSSTNLLANQNLAGFKSQFQLAVPNWGSVGVQDGSSTSFNNRRELCTDYATNKDCSLRLSLQIIQTSVMPIRYAFAYRIETNPLAVSMPALGTPGAFTANDYSVGVPVTAYNSVIVCDGVNPVAATGYNTNTGRMTCLQGPTTQCPAGSFPTGLSVNAEKNINFTCQTLTQVGCNNGLYAVSRFSPQTLDSRSGQSAALSNSTCQFIGQVTTVSLTGPLGEATKNNWPTANTSGQSGYGLWRHGVLGPGGTQWGTFCPPGYNAEITQCAAVIAATLGSAQPARCPAGYPGNCNSDTGNLVLGGAIRSAGVWFGPAATYAGAPVPPANVGAVLSGAQSNQAYCVLNNGSQPAGAGWSGYVNMQVRCNLNTNAYPVNVPPAAL